MSKNPEKNIWKKNGIAPLDFCSISRAAKILDCEESDILHWCYTGKINLGVNLKTLYLYYITLRKDMGPLELQLDSFNSITEQNEDGSHRFYSDKEQLGNFYIPLNPDVIETNSYYLVRVIASGFWPIENFILEDISYGKTNSKDIVLHTEIHPEFKPNVAITYSLISPTLLVNNFAGRLSNINKKDKEYLDTLCEHAPDINSSIYELQIAGYYIEYIYKHSLSGSKIPALERTYESKHQNLNEKVETSSVRTTAKQSSYIAALMNALGVTEEMMRFNSISQVREHLNRQVGDGIYLPDITDDTLDDWLKRAGKR